MSIATETKPKLTTISANGTWVGESSADVTSGEFSFRVSEPQALGGNNSGPNPFQYLIGAFEGCIAVVVETVSKEQNFDIDSADISISGTLDLRGFEGVEGVSPHFQSVVGEVNIGANLDAEQFAFLVTETERRCPIYNLIKDAGVTPQISWNLNN
ncbi:OsmC family protein [Flaviflexus massiliensis]|uniref:OsmC family protein n=1 Tax=Flaviflexus massiliensis TaxID=1522309 RepID=UPI0006D55C90|nr:OsmC family protein [Flaviflexus massiliensis]